MNKHQQISIRRARKHDFDDVFPMIRDLARLDGGICLFKKKDFLRATFGKEKCFTMFVAVYNKKCIGYITFHPGYDIQSASKGFYLIDLFVKKRYRRQNVAMLLMSATATVSKKMGGTWLSWHVNPGNTQAIAFYEKLGSIKTSSLQYVLDVYR